MEDTHRHRSKTETLSELSQLSRDIHEQSGKEALETIRQFIDLYIHHQKLSEEFFMSLCEHKILDKLFAGKGMDTLDILETFNLLLANSNKLQQLVFIFSQPALHEFLFQKITIDKDHTDVIEYYSQLLKSIVLKISANGNHSLIKLFCNNRFPHFPLLTTITVIAVDTQQEQLTRVTANQSLLLMIRLINQTKIGIEYLSELQMLVYYHEIIKQLLHADQEQQNELINFVADLLLSLAHNVTSLAIFMNLVTNQLLFTHLQQPHKILQFLSFFYEQLAEHCPEIIELVENIVLVMFRIVTKYYSANSINYTYYTAQRVLYDYRCPSKPELLQFYTDRCKRIEQYLIKQTPMLDDQKELEFVLEQWMHFNYKNKELSPLKPQRPKSKNALEQFFTSKQQLAEDYLKSIMTLAGINQDKLKHPIHKLSFSTNYQTALYLVQSVIRQYEHTNKMDPVQIFQHYSRDDIWQLKINTPLLIELYKIANRVNKNHSEPNSPNRMKSSAIPNRNQMETNSPNKMKSVIDKSADSLSHSSKQSSSKQEERKALLGFNYFIQHIKTELVSMFCAALTIQEQRPDLNELTLMSAIVRKMSLYEQLEANHLHLLLTKLKDLQVYITEDVFSEENFHFVLKYFTKNREKTLLNRMQRPNEEEKPSPKNVFHSVKARIQKNFVQYEVIKRFIDPSLLSIGEFNKNYWQCRFFTQKEGKSLPITQFLFKDSNGITLEVIADHNYEFAVKKSKKDHQSIIFAIGRDDCHLDKNNPTYLSFEDHKVLIDLQTEEKAKHFREDLNKLRKQRMELIMNGILQYLTFSYESLNAVTSLRTSRKSLFHTPHKK